MIYNVTIWVYSRCYLSLKVFDNVDIGPVLKIRHDGQFRRRHIWSLSSVLLPLARKIKKMTDMLMTQEEQYYYNLLSSIYPCKVPFTICVKDDKPKTRLGTYWPSRKHILIHTGRRDKYDPVETAIHEYAHHIHYTEFDKEKKKQAPHGKEFWQIYGQLMNRANEMGLCKPERGVVLIFPKLDNKASLVDPANGSSNSSFRELFKGILKSGKI